MNPTSPPTAFQFVVKKTGLKPNECNCSKCVKMCRTTPCIGTPEDIAKIAQAGFEERLQVTMWASGMPYGIPPVPIIAPRFDTERGCCTFLTEFGLCELHESGLKPTEGKLATCDPAVKATPDNHPAFIIAKMWMKELHEIIFENQTSEV